MSIVAQILLGFLASMVVAWFSRFREFRADRAGAEFSGTSNMINALERLKSSQPTHLPKSLRAFGIGVGFRSGMGRLFATHPPLDQRISALKQIGV